VIYLYSLLGLGGLGAVIYIVRSVMDWGAAKEREDGLVKDNAELEGIVKGLRDVSKIHDDIERDNVERLRIRDKYK